MMTYSDIYADKKITAALNYYLRLLSSWKYNLGLLPLERNVE